MADVPAVFFAVDLVLAVDRGISVMIKRWVESVGGADRGGVSGRDPLHYDCDTAVGYEGTCVIAVDFVLGSRGHRDVTLGNVPGTLAGKILAVILFGKLTDAAAIYVLELEYIVELLAGHAFGHIDGAVRVAHRHDLCSECEELVGCIGSHIARA